jgi:AcrR family transcriptional regulator
MSSTEPRPLRADARRNRERIVDVARELFAECGQATQMDDVARRAGVGVGTVYRHFPTKDALLGELMRAKFARHAEVARRWSDEPDGWTAMEGFLRETFADMARDATQQTMLWVTSDAALEYAEDQRRDLAATVDGIIVRAREQGTLREDFTVDDMPALMCTVGGLMSARSRHVRRPEHMIEIVLDGLRAR